MTQLSGPGRQWFVLLLNFISSVNWVSWRSGQWSAYQWWWDVRGSSHRHMCEDHIRHWQSLLCRNNLSSSALTGPVLPCSWTSTEHLESFLSFSWPATTRHDPELSSQQSAGSHLHHSQHHTGLTTPPPPHHHHTHHQHISQPGVPGWRCNSDWWLSPHLTMCWSG